MNLEKARLLLASLLLFAVLSGTSTANALGPTDRQFMGDSYSIIDGSSPQTDMDMELPTDIDPAGSFVVWTKDGYVFGSTYTEYHTLDDQSEWFWNDSCFIPSGVTYTYVWEQTVSHTLYQETDLSAEVKASASSIVASIESKVASSLVASETIQHTVGTTSTITVNEPGYWEINWYHKAKIYNVYGYWRGTTIDDHTERPMLRFLGRASEPTPWEHKVVIKR